MAAVVELVDAPVAIKPPLKWAGGKRWLVPYLSRLRSPHRTRRLVEPLCGGLAVSLGLRAPAALINDINPHAINFYRWLKKGLRIIVSMRNEKELFYAHRARFNDLVRKGKQNSREAASLFYFLNRTCFNGLCRFNQSGEFNVPFGRYKSIGYKTDFSEYRAVFAQWHFMSVDFQEVPLESDDFIYADPPYDVEFTQYAKEVFDWDDQVRLARWLARHPGPVVLSNQATPRILELYRSLGFETVLLKAPRLINCTGDRTPADEVLAIRNL
ncbi:MAG: DNA adenine methylase [Candidatus Binataceae bacterium]